MRLAATSSGISNGTGAMILVGVALVIVLFVLRMRKGIREDQARIARATPAEAEVIQVGRSHASQESGTVNVRLRLEITSSDRSPSQVTVIWDVEPAVLLRVQVGARVPVAVDLEDPAIIYPRIEGAYHSWVPSRS